MILLSNCDIGKTSNLCRQATNKKSENDNTGFPIPFLAKIGLVTANQLPNHLNNVRKIFHNCQLGIRRISPITFNDVL